MFNVLKQLMCRHDWELQRYDVNVIFILRKSNVVWKEDFDTYIIKQCKKCGSTKKYYLWGVINEHIKK